MPDDRTDLDPRRWSALAVCLAGGSMVLLDVSIVNVALPSIRTGLGASGSALQWVLSGYALAFGLALVPAGRLGDLLGRRTMFTIALAAFTLASAACGLATSAEWLIIARLVQGLAGGCVTPQISALIQENFAGEERGKAFGLFGTVVGVSTAVGPLLGGTLIALFGTEHGWRWVFFVNVPIGAVLIPVALRILPARSARTRRASLDPIGVVLLGAGIVTLLLPFVQAEQWETRAKWLLVPLAALILGLFVLWERHVDVAGRDPLFELRLFAKRSYGFGNALITLYFAAFTPLFFVFTLYLQSGQGYSALLAGVATVPFAVGSAATAARAGKLSIRIGRPLVAVGLALVAVGLIGVALAVHLAPSSNTGWATLLPLLIAGIGSGMIISPNQALTLADVPVERAGTAGGMLQTAQRLGSALGIAGVGAVFYGHLASSPGASAYPDALERSLLVAIGFVALSLLVALADIAIAR
ncbi:MAG: putative permease of the major facilitator superfamily, partial [Pseudonocardiales bacterium]|nr:putative permease of the major facilitator superfamily [Pseudonocardiales bacterium]